MTLRGDRVRGWGASGLEGWTFKQCTSLAWSVEGNLLVGSVWGSCVPWLLGSQALDFQHLATPCSRVPYIEIRDTALPLAKTIHVVLESKRAAVLRLGCLWDFRWRLNPKSLLHKTRNTQHNLKSTC